MKKWQRYARTAVGLAAAAFAGTVLLTLRERRSPGTAPPVTTSDPAAVVESSGGRTLRVNREHEDIRIEYERLTAYTDGTSRMFGVTIVTERAGGRTFTVTGDEGRSGQQETTLDLRGHVHITSSDGIDVRTEAASYAEQDGTVRAPGPVVFTQGRTNGQATGFRYDKTADTVTLLADVEMHLAQGSHGPGAATPGGGTRQDLQITARSAEYRRPARTMRFDGAARAVRGTRVVEGETLVALLDGSGNRLERLTVSGDGRVADTKPGPGGLQSLVGRDIDLTYQPDGDALDQVRVTGAGRLTMAAQRGPGSEIAADSIAIGMASDGVTPTALDASARVTVSLPTDANGIGAPKRTVAADAMTSRGEEVTGLTRARFEGNVVFRERGAALERTARAGVLDVAVSAGLGSVDDARFSRNVRFEDGPLTADAPAATYLVSQGSLSLRRGEAGTEGAVPHLRNDRISVSARELDVVLDGPGIEGKGDVKSEMRPGSRRAGGVNGGSTGGTAKMPSMLKADQPVSITADALSYDGEASGATYRGGAQLWQGDTTIRAAELVLDEKTGDLTATGSVATSIGLRTSGPDARASATQQGGGTGRTRSTVTAQNLRYEEGTRKATYTGKAHLTGEQGDMQANKIELFLKPSGDEIERVEAYDVVTLRDRDRRTTGSRLTYVADGERYVVTGSPVTIIDECDRETVGRTLTFDRISDKLVVDGSERARTRTKGRSNCQ